MTALRLGRASCNGKGRLFVALARTNGIPARLVGGVILNEGSKKTSHQWLEVLIEGRWVPFDPTNGHFATLPENYLRLYTGDHALFRHTRNINFDYLF
ncbi:MAG: transglutaminase family protein, partial [Pseudomonadota bacterium]